MKQKELIQKIMKRKEYSKLPLQDVKLALSFFDKKDVIDEERVKLTNYYIRFILALLVRSF